IGSTLQDLLQRHAAVLDATATGAEVRIGDGPTAREYELVTSAVTDHRGGQAGHLVHLRDITERKQAERHLRFLADSDPLTGLPNRRVLGDRLGQAISRCQRSRGPCALLLFDLDGFKAINDTFGHQTGDLVLEQVALRLRTGRRDGDTVARLSGDEFAILLPEVADARDAALVARRALALIAEPMHLDGRQLHVTASAGVAVWPDDGWDARQLFDRVDAAMYRAKQQGRNQARTSQDGRRDSIAGRRGAGSEPVTTAVSAPPSVAERWQLGRQLGEALRRGELRVSYQPLVSLRDNEVTGMAAELTWQHPRHGELPPPAFLPLAEDLHLTDDIGRWVLAEACRQAHRWASHGRRIPLWVPLSPRRLRGTGPGVRGALHDDVQRVLHATELPAGLLVLQVREQDVVDDPDTVPALHALRDLGVGLALDRFGADHTSLTELRRLPVDTLRLDRELLEAARTDGGGLRVLSAVTTLAHLLGRAVVADGVDRPEALDLLHQVGCDAAQGTMLCPPLDAATAERLVATVRTVPAGPSEPITARAAAMVSDPGTVTVTSAASAP
ncbi:MAG TPA: bifunctional diguanylate cyclase/phosphodiesterase, partial [Kineosporiaceae bacterium]